MARGLSKKLENEIRSQLSTLVNAEPGTYIGITLGTPLLQREATFYLRDLGAFEELASGGTYRLTANGREYWEKITSPRWYWFRRNWFPASVAAGTILFSSVAAAANIVNLLL